MTFNITCQSHQISDSTFATLDNSNQQQEGDRIRKDYNDHEFSDCLGFLLNLMMDRQKYKPLGTAIAYVPWVAQFIIYSNQDLSPIYDFHNLEQNIPSKHLERR